MDRRSYWVVYTGEGGSPDPEMRDEVGDFVGSQAIRARRSPHENWLDWVKLGMRDGVPRVRVLVSSETSWLTTVELLKKITAWIEEEGALSDFSDDPFMRDPPS